MKLRLAGLLCVGSLLLAGVASAATTQIKSTAVNGVSGLTSTAYDGASVLGSTGWAGAWDSTIVSGFTPGGHPASWLAFCMDLANGSSSGATYTYQASTFDAGDPPASGPPNPTWVTGGGSKAGYLYQKHAASATTAVLRSALAIAVWEVLYESDTTYSVSSKAASGKGFQVAGNGSTAANDAIAQANTWLADATADFFDGAPNTTWWQEANSGADPQSLLGPVSMVPEPSTYIAGLLLGLPVFVNGVRFWRKRRAR